MWMGLWLGKVADTSTLAKPCYIAYLNVLFK